MRFNPLYRGTRFPTLGRRFSCQLLSRCFNPLYRGTRFPTTSSGKRMAYFAALFQSAISRYSVSNVINELAQMREDVRFNPLYRGTRFPTLCTLFILLLERRCFNPLYRGTRFPTWRHMPPKRMEIYRFQSAISRYSVSNDAENNQDAIEKFSFNPLYRGTRFPTRSL